MTISVHISNRKKTINLDIKAQIDPTEILSKYNEGKTSLKINHLKKDRSIRPSPTRSGKRQIWR